MERSINELMLTKQAHVDAIKELDAEIIQKAESHRREMEQVLKGINGNASPRRNSVPKRNPKLSTIRKAYWAAKKANTQSAEAVA